MKATIRAEEKQREQVGLELHDEVGHVLTYTSLFLQMLTQGESIRPEQINKAHQQVEHALQELKRISRNLVPPALIDLGLKEAIIELFNQYTELRGLHFDIQCNPNEFSNINMDVKKNLYRIIQELVSNTHKHAKARTVRLTIRKAKDNIQLEYFNDGKTFNPARIKKGAGFESIQNRVYFYNGTFHVYSSRQDGNRFIIELPLKNILEND
jgi:two-component system sensor histidine kinase UhpB